MLSSTRNAFVVDELVRSDHTDCVLLGDSVCGNVPAVTRRQTDVGGRRVMVGSACLSGAPAGEVLAYLVSRPWCEKHNDDLRVPDMRGNCLFIRVAWQYHVYGSIRKV